MINVAFMFLLSIGINASRGSRNRDRYLEDFKHALDNLSESGRGDVIRQFQDDLECCGIHGSPDYEDCPGSHNKGCFDFMFKFEENLRISSLSNWFFSFIIIAIAGCIYHCRLRDRFVNRTYNQANVVPIAMHPNMAPQVFVQPHQVGQYPLQPQYPQQPLYLSQSQMQYQPMAQPQVQLYQNPQPMIQVPQPITEISQPSAQPAIQDPQPSTQASKLSAQTPQPEFTTSEPQAAQPIDIAAKRTAPEVK